MYELFCPSKRSCTDRIRSKTNVAVILLGGACYFQLVGSVSSSCQTSCLKQQIIKSGFENVCLKEIKLMKLCFNWRPRHGTGKRHHKGDGHARTGGLILSPQLCSSKKSTCAWTPCGLIWMAKPWRRWTPSGSQ